jgi:glycine oxidase
MSDPVTAPKSSALRTIIVGGGAAGLACAWRLARAGAAVTLLDRGPPGTSALWASGGMLAAGFEASVELEGAHRLAQPFADALKQAAEMWPDWAAQLQSSADAPLGYQRRGVLTPLLSEADEARAADVLDQAARLKVEAVRLTAQEVRARETGLAPARGAIVFPGDGQLDNRALAPALRRAIKAAGGRVDAGAEVAALERHAGAVSGVRLTDGRVIGADLVVLATGASPVPGAPASARMRPVKGQMLAFDLAPERAPQHVVRGFGIYLAAKPGGRLVVGATVEPDIDDLGTDADALERLKQRACDVLPELAGCAPVEAWSGLRPASRDDMPVIGMAEPGLAIAGGGYRNGVLLAPLIAEKVCAQAFDRPVSEIAAAFSPLRRELQDGL